METIAKHIEVNIGDLLKDLGDGVFVDFIFLLSKLKHEEQCAIITVIFNEVSQLNKRSISELMSMHLDIFVSAIHAQPDSKGKDEFVLDAINSIKLHANNTAKLNG